MFLKATVITAALLLFCVPGYVLKRVGLLGDGAKSTLGNILLYVCQPAMIIAAFAVFSDADYQVIRSVSRVVMLRDFAIAGALSLVAIGAVFCVCKLIFIKSSDRATSDVYTFFAVFSNCGFLGLPFVKMFTDNDPLAAMYLMVFNLVFSIAVWTLGVYLISHDRKQISAKKVLLNPTVISTAVALLLFFVPEINFFMLDGLKELGTVPSALSAMTAPVAMMLVGVSLAEMPFKAVWNRAGYYVCAALRLLVAPMLAFALAVAFKYIFIGAIDGASDYIFLSPVLAMAMSPASVGVAMAQRFNGNSELAAAAYANNSVLSLVTVPLVVTAVVWLWAFV